MNSSREIVRKIRENRMLNERKDYSKMDRNELIKLAQSGDQLAVETLINTHQDMIINFSKRYHLDTGDFDDIKQYVTMAFWEAIQSWDMTGNFEAYAGMIIKRKMVDVLRSEDTGKTKISTQAAQLDAPSGTDDEGGEMTLGATLQSKSLSPEEEYIGNEGYRKLLKFMSEELSEVELRVIKKYIEGYKVSEISKEEDMKYKTVENALMRVKNKIADYLRNVRESRKLRMNESIFSDEEKKMLKSILNQIDGMNESKDVEEHLEVSAGAGSTTAEKVAYVKEMVQKAKENGDEHSAWDIVDFLYDSMLLDKIPLDESKKMNESRRVSNKSEGPFYLVKSYNRRWADYFIDVVPTSDRSSAIKAVASDDDDVVGVARVDRVSFSKVIDRLKESEEMDIDDMLNDIRYRAEEIIHELNNTENADTFNELFNELSELTSSIFDREEDMSDEQYSRAEKLYSDISRSSDLVCFNGPAEDPYIAAGVSRSDFF